VSSSSYKVGSRKTLLPPPTLSGGVIVGGTTGADTCNTQRSTRASNSAAEGISLKNTTLNQISAAGTAETTAGIPQRPFIKEIVLDNNKDSVFVMKATGTEPIKVTIAWSDPAGPGQTTAALDPTTSRLVNDIDLTVTRVNDGVVFKPWRLDPTNPSAAATNTYTDSNGNFRGNVEQVVTFGTLPTLNQEYRITVKQKAGTTVQKADAAGTLSTGNQFVSIILSAVKADQGQNLAINSFYHSRTTLNSPQETLRGDFTWTAVVGQKYVIEKSTNLLTWARNSDEIIATSNTVTFSSYNSIVATGFAGVYYRVRAVPTFPTGIAP
jgi:hypothetical protein